MSTCNRRNLSDLPPSAKLVYKILEYNGELTQKQIIAESRLSPRTVRYAIEKLECIEVIEEDVYFADARQDLYRLSSAENADSQ